MLCPMPGTRHTGAALTLAAVIAAAAAPAAAAGSGGAVSPISGAGGVEYGAAVKAAPPPTATRFSVTPRTLVAGGDPPAIVLRIDEDGTPRVKARVVFWPVKGTGAAVVRIPMGEVRVGRTLRVRWPRGTALQAGRYVVRVHATDPGGRPLSRSHQDPGRVDLTVKAKPKPKPQPAPKPTTPAPPPVVTAGAVFPVQGAHTFGDLFGAQRSGYTHQGVDVLAAQGTPIVSPTAGTIRFTDYQASAAGEYIVERLADGRDVFYAHCVRHSTVVTPGQTVAAGTPLCQVGQTGDATGPHLHFELWPAGWRDIKGTEPVDPLGQLKAWGG